MKRMITMIIAIAMVITSVVVPTNTASAAEEDNKNSWNSMSGVDLAGGEYDDIDSVYAKISYDKKGNLVGKVKIKNFSNRKCRITIYTDSNIDFGYVGKDFNYKYKKYRINKQRVAKKFTLKRGKTKMLTVKIPKSKIKGKYYNLREVETHIAVGYSAGFYNKTGKRIVRHESGGLGGMITPVSERD